jgi:D-3-phosphoglycerate dehydrogenase
MSLKIETSDGVLWVEGARFEHGGARLVLLDGVEIEAGLDGTHIVVRNRDEPGVIGAIGTILGTHGINVASFALGRGPSGAIAVVNVDEPTTSEGPALDDRLLDALCAVPAVWSADLVRV